ncbi:MAG: hypothetical protein E7384_03790 [Ruminococcaceae bacterium]|nr:hypothetical protein [Oscillospiraceae bacterium]
MAKKSILKNILIICGLFIVLIAATFSWFVMRDSGDIGNLEMAVIDAAYIKVSKDEGLTWENNLDLDLGTIVSLRETTGDGVTFYEPVYDGTDSISGYVQSANENVYFESVITFKTDRTQSIYLTDESFIVPADTASDTKNKSEFGNYSKDYIAGAIRVGFFELTDAGEYKPVFIWVPNPKIQYNAKNNTVTENGTVEDYYSYYANGEEPGFVKIMTNGESDGMSDPLVWGSLQQDGVKPVLSFDKETEAEPDGSITKKLIARVWVEGTDRECVRALYQGKFKMYFKFQAVREVSNNEE